jgi:hypothetical protein
MKPSRFCPFRGDAAATNNFFFFFLLLLLTPLARRSAFGSNFFLTGDLVGASDRRARLHSKFKKSV